MTHHHHEPVDADPGAHWEARYGESEQIWSGRANASTAAVAQTLTPGRALDLGSGEGGDAIWLAEHGWQVMAVDLSSTAVERARAAAVARHVPQDAVTFEAHDLTTWQPPSGHPGFDLVTASFFHSDVALERTEILRRAARWLTPGGHLLLVSHAAPPPWSQHHDHRPMPSPQEELAELDLPSSDFDTVLCEVRRRPAVSPDGEETTLDDGVTLVRRRP